MWRLLRRGQPQLEVACLFRALIITHGLKGVGSAPARRSSRELVVVVVEEGGALGGGGGDFGVEGASEDARGDERDAEDEDEEAVGDEEDRPVAMTVIQKSLCMMMLLN